MKTTRIHRTVLTGVMASGIVAVLYATPALAQSIEDRLRAQLRETTMSLRQAQDQQSQLQADKAAAEQQRDKALADLRQSQADLAAAKGKSVAEVAAQHALTAEKASHEQDNRELAKYRSEYASLSTLARSKDAESLQISASLETQKTQLQTCEVKNEQLYQIGHDILDTYEHAGMSTFVKSRQPFAESARVKYDMVLQGYGDKLYDGKYDPRAVPPKSASTPVASR